VLGALVFSLSASALSADLFEYGDGEKVVLEHVFDNDDGWGLNKATISDGELKAMEGQQWAGARREFPPLDLHYGDISVYWRFRSTPRSGEHGKLYLNLSLTSDPYQWEQRNLCLNIRPGTQHIFYIDPGNMCFPHHSEMLLTHPAGVFTDPSIYESFRLVIRKTGPDSVVVEPYYWDRALGAWLMYRTPYDGRERPAPPMLASIKKNMQWQSYFESLGFGMFTDIPSVRACAVTQISRFPADQMTDQAAEVRLLRTLDYWRVDAVVLDANSSAMLRMERANAAHFPVQETLQWRIAEGTAWKISPERVTTKLAPDERRELEFTLELAGDFSDALPLPRLESTLALARRTVKRTRVLRIDMKASFAEPLAGTCVRAKTAPDIDGNLDDPVWQECTALSRFIGRDLLREIGHPAACIPAVHQTEARLAYDNDNLYVSFRCHEPNLEGMVVKVAERDGFIWQDDSLELWLDTNLDKDTYYHFAFNPNGVTFDEEKKPGPILGNLDSRWNSPCTVKAGREPGAWTLEVALPWKSMGMTAPKAGKKLGMGVQRNRKQGAGEMSQWSPTFSGWGHVPDRFGVLILE